MKKFLSTFIFILSTIFAFGQISVGAKTGLNYAYFPAIEDGVALNFINNPILATHIGAIAEFELSERFALSTELLYSIKGSEINQSFPTFQTTSTFAASYISVPISAKVKISKLGFLAGIEPSVLASERARFNSDPWERTNLFFSKFDFSLIGGIDLRLGKLYFAARYNHGLSDAFQINFTDQNGQAIGTGDKSNRVFQFSAGYFFLN